MRSSSRRPIVCGVDIGSTNAKVVALDPEGHVVARAARPTPREPDGLSIDAFALFNAIEEMVVWVCGDRYEVHGAGSAGVGEDGFLVDAGLRPLTKALTWFDPRRGPIFDALRSQLVDEERFDVESDPVRTIVGWEWSKGQVAAGAARSWVALSDLAGVSWSGRPFLSDTLASRTAAWRSSDRTWSLERVELTLGSPSLLPPVVSTGEIVGELRSPGMRLAGVVAPDAIAVAGGHDHPIGGWGVNQFAPETVLDSMGTAEVVVAHSDDPTLSRFGLVDVSPGIRAEGVTLLRVEEIARNVEWASRDPEVGRHITKVLAGSTRPAAVLDSGYFVPGGRGGGSPRFVAGAPQDPLARASAVLGALAHLGRDAVAAVSSGVAGTPGVSMAGGWVRSPGWIDIKSAVNGVEVNVIEEPEVTAVGVALLVARARGWTPDPALAFSGVSRR